MPIVSSQRSIADEAKPKYFDVEGVIYHYPLRRVNAMVS